MTTATRPSLFDPRPRKSTAPGLWRPRKPSDVLFAPRKDAPPTFTPNEDGNTRIETALSMPVKRKFSPMVLFLLGRRGAGKTLVMAALGKYLMDAYRERNVKRRILSNFELKYLPDGSSDPYLLDRIIANPYEYRECLILVDEIANAFPGRRAMSSINVEFVDFLTQIRKLRSECIFATQFASVVDRDLLLQVDIFARCNSIAEGRHVVLDMHDYWGQWTGNDDSKPWPPPRDVFDWQRTVRNTWTMFGAYDTYEMVVGMRKQNRDDLIAANWNIVSPQQEMEALTADENREQLEALAADEFDAAWAYIGKLDAQINSRQVWQHVKQMFLPKATLLSVEGMLEAAGYARTSASGRTWVKTEGA